MSASKVAFIGIGRMGWHMAGHLVKADPPFSSTHF